MLFTDIEGSTRLLNELGAEVYDQALAEHRRLLREAFGRHGGVEIDTHGVARTHSRSPSAQIESESPSLPRLEACGPR